MEEFRHPKEHSGLAAFTGEPPDFSRFRVNLLVGRDGAEGAPVVYEDHPTYQNLIGRVEHVAQLGALVTNFMLIKPGALHQANGGYLLLDAFKLLTQPFSWEGLKRALVLAGRERFLSQAGFHRMLDAIECPVVLAR